MYATVTTVYMSTEQWSMRPVATTYECMRQWASPVDHQYYTLFSLYCVGLHHSISLPSALVRQSCYFDTTKGFVRVWRTLEFSF